MDDQILQLFSDVKKAGVSVTFARHPAERYLRIRMLAGLSEDRLWLECSKHLRLPGLTSRADKKEFERIVKDFRVRGKLREVPKSSSTGGRPKERPIPWMDERPDSQLTESEYMDRHGLTPYVEVGPDGRRYKARAARLENAILLWCDDVARPLIRAMIVGGKGDDQIAEDVYEVCPTVLRTKIRAVDILSVRELLFDLSMLSLNDRIVFLGSVAMDPIEVGTAISGVEAYRFRMGMAHLDITDLHRMRTVRDVAYLRIDEMRVRPESFDSRAFQVSSAVMIDSIERIKELEAELAAKSEDSIQHLRMREAEDFKPYANVLAEAQKQGALKMVKEVFEIGGLTRTDYEDLLASIEAGHPLAPTTRIMLQQRRDEHYLRTQQEEGEDAAPEVGHYSMPGFGAAAEHEPLEASDDGGRTHDLSLKALLGARKSG